MSSVSPFRVTARHGAQELAIRLDGIYKRYRHGETDVASVVEEVKAALGVVAAGVQAAGPFPRLEPWDRLPPGCLHLACPFDPDLAAYFVRVLPSGHLAVPAHAADEGPGPEALLGAAVDALRDQTREMAVEGRGAGSRAVLGYAIGDGLDASRALVPELLAAMAEWVEGTPLVAIPTPDVLMLLGDTDPVFVAEAAEYVGRLYTEAASPISPHLYSFVSGRLQRLG